MNLIIFALFVILILAIVVYALDRAPIAPNLRAVLVILSCVVAAVALAYRLGWLT